MIVCLGDGQFGVCLIDETTSVSGWDAPELVGTIAKITKCSDDVKMDGLQLHSETLGRNSFRIKKLIPPSIPQPKKTMIHFQLKDINKFLRYMKKLELEKMYIQSRVEMIPEIDEHISIEQWQKLVELWKKKIIQQALPQVC